MQLTIVQLFKRTVNGHIFRGKNRLIRQVRKSGMDNLVKEYERQEKNMLLLRHPYLTMDESSGHTKSLEKQKKLVDKWRNEQTANKMKPHITLESRLMHLKVKESWD